MVYVLLIQEEFDIDILSDASVKRAVDKNLCGRFKSYRQSMRNHFRKHGDEAEHHPFDSIEQQDWNVIYAHFRYPYYQVIDIIVSFLVKMHELHYIVSILN